MEKSQSHGERRASLGRGGRAATQGSNYRVPAPRRAGARGKTRADAKTQLLSTFPGISQLDTASNAAPTGPALGEDARVPGAGGSGVSF